MCLLQILFNGYGKTFYFLNTNQRSKYKTYFLIYCLDIIRSYSKTSSINWCSTFIWFQWTGNSKTWRYPTKQILLCGINNKYRKFQISLCFITYVCAVFRLLFFFNIFVVFFSNCQKFLPNMHESFSKN